MDTSPIGRGPNDVTTVAGDAQVEQAIATLVMAFGSDPVVRWIYADPHRYLKHIPRLFRVEGETVAKIVPLDGKNGRSALFNSSAMPNRNRSRRCASMQVRG
jgi:hypothetical protein